MRNEIHIILICLYRLTQRSRIFLARDQKYLCLKEAGEPGKILSSQFIDELKIVVHPVGKSLQQEGDANRTYRGKEVYL
jgi:hypothetical protein